MENSGVYNTIYLMFQSPALMLYLLLLSVTCLIPDLCLRIVRTEGSKDRDIKKVRGTVITCHLFGNRHFLLG